MKGLSFTYTVSSLIYKENDEKTTSIDCACPSFLMTSLPSGFAYAGDTAYFLYYKIYLTENIDFFLGLKIF